MQPKVPAFGLLGGSYGFVSKGWKQPPFAEEPDRGGGGLLNRGGRLGNNERRPK